MAALAMQPIMRRRENTRTGTSPCATEIASCPAQIRQSIKRWIAGTVVRAPMPSKGKISRSSVARAGAEELRYRVELWHDGLGDTIERVLGRALNAQLARAIFQAAIGEYPNRRITLRKGTRLIADSANE